jgi:hypothetical protein
VLQTSVVLSESITKISEPLWCSRLRYSHFQTSVLPPAALRVVGSPSSASTNSLVRPGWSCSSVSLPIRVPVCSVRERESITQAGRQEQSSRQPSSLGFIFRVGGGGTTPAFRLRRPP